MQNTGKNQGSRTEQVKQALICCLQDLQLKPGDALPTQAVLREKLHVGAVTVQRAIAALADAGILEVRPHKGVFVRRFRTEGFVGREIGLVCLWRTFYPAAASMLQCLQLQLHKKACQCKLFLRNFPEMTEVDSLSFFDGLKRCIETGQIQGLITTVSFDDEAWAFFRRHKLPVVSLSSASRNGGYKVTGEDILPEFFDLARKRGFRRPALFHSGYPLTGYVRNLFAARTNLPPDRYCCILWPDMIEEDRLVIPEEKLRRSLREFSAMPKSKRPDVLLIPDDILCSFVYREVQNLKLEGSSWDPHFIYLANRQIPILPLDGSIGDCFKNDIMEQAEAATELLLNVIRGRETKERSICIKPKFIEQKTDTSERRRKS